MIIITLTYFRENFIKMEIDALNQIKTYVQKILDKYLVTWKRFSIQDLDEESTFLLIDLLLEKDDLEREHIWNQIENKLIESEKWLKLDYDKINEIKNKIIIRKLEKKEELRLKELDNIEKELDEKLKEI